MHPQARLALAARHGGGSQTRESLVPAVSPTKVLDIEADLVLVLGVGAGRGVWCDVGTARARCARRLGRSRASRGARRAPARALSGAQGRRNARSLSSPRSVMLPAPKWAGPF